jgi:aspartate beta-hydroxylase
MDDMSGKVIAYLEAAAIARDQNNGAEELRYLDAALGIAPDHPRVLNSRGMYALNHDDPAFAKVCFTRAAKADPCQPALWMNVATACRALSDDSGEQSSLENVLDIDRLDFMAQLRMAELHERKRDQVNAAISWNNIVQMALQMDQRLPRVEDALVRGQAFLAAHSDGVAMRIDAELGLRLKELGPAARRFKACVDYSVGRRAIFHNECAGLHYPFLPADEFFDRDHFPWLAEIEARTDAIRDEALAMLSSSGEAIRPYVRMEKGGPETKWSPLDGSLDWSACFLWEYGERHEAVCARCPETVAALDSLPRNHIPGKAPSAFFSVLKPGAHIPAHTGVTNTRAIIHLPLVVPDGCTFRVGGETREWRVGEAFAFDDTIQHEAWNRSDQTRIILIFDVWNPHLTPEEQELLVDYFALSERP